jgi:hypothetical protein
MASSLFYLCVWKGACPMICYPTLPREGPGLLPPPHTLTKANIVVVSTHTHTHTHTHKSVMFIPGDCGGVRETLTTFVSGRSLLRFTLWGG